jgi:hypothetical protein
LPLSSLIPRSSAARRRRRTVGLAGAVIGRSSFSVPRAGGFRTADERDG